MSIKNIVFDFGNVICRYDPYFMMESFPLSEEEKELFSAKIFNSPFWKDADRGYSYRDVLFHDVLQELPDSLKEFFYACVARYDFEEKFMPLNPGIDDLIVALKQRGYKIFLLSNIGLNFHYLSLKLPVLSLFDGKFASCDFGLIKPEEAVYQAFFDKFSIAPEECIFIDDSHENVSASEKAGMRALTYNAMEENVYSLSRKLKSFGIECYF